jgi:putative oxidoreductase
MLLSTMAVASAMHVVKGDSFTKASHAIESAIVFASMFFVGAGKWALDRRVGRG